MLDIKHQFTWYLFPQFTLIAVSPPVFLTRRIVLLHPLSEVVNISPLASSAWSVNFGKQSTFDVLCPKKNKRNPTFHDRRYSLWKRLFFSGNTSNLINVISIGNSEHFSFKLELGSSLLIVRWWLLLVFPLHPPLGKHCYYVTSLS